MILEKSLNVALITLIQTIFKGCTFTKLRGIVESLMNEWNDKEEKNKEVDIKEIKETRNVVKKKHDVSVEMWNEGVEQARTGKSHHL